MYVPAVTVYAPMLQFLLVSAIPSIVLACASLPPGGELQLLFQVDGFTPALEFAYSTKAELIQKFPTLQSTTTNAKQRLRQVIRQAILQTIKKEAKAAGLESMTAQLSEQIQTNVIDNPILCKDVQQIGGTSGQTPPAGEPGYVCLTTENVITNVQYDKDPKPLPGEFQQFIVILKVKNAILAGWSREMWEITAMKVQRQLRQGTFAGSFKTAEMSLI